MDWTINTESTLQKWREHYLPTAKNKNKNKKIKLQLLLQPFNFSFNALNLFFELRLVGFQLLNLFFFRIEVPVAAARTAFEGSWCTTLLHFITSVHFIY